MTENASAAANSLSEEFPSLRKSGKDVLPVPSSLTVIHRILHDPPSTITDGIIFDLLRRLATVLTPTMLQSAGKHSNLKMTDLVAVAVSNFGLHKAGEE